MSAELLRRAAKKMRSDAEAAIADGGGSDHDSLAVRDYVASWHPSVALAVAEWLDQTAEWLDQTAAWWDPATEAAQRPDYAAFAVAHTYLGEDAS